MVGGGGGGGGGMQGEGLVESSGEELVSNSPL